MRKFLIATSFGSCVLFSSVASAQTPQATPKSKLAWDQDAPDLATAQAYVYQDYVDAAAPITLVGVTCTGTVTPFQCQVAFPVTTNGNHSLQLSSSNAAGESLKSNPFAFVFVTVPTPPRNIKVIG